MSHQYPYASRLRCLHRLLLRVALASFVLRALIPAGFMPAPLSDGWPIQLCPDGLTSAQVQVLLGSDGSHHHDHHDAADQRSGAEDFHCSLGVVLSAAYLPEDDIFKAPKSDVPVPETTASAAVQSLRRLAFRSRAPPLS